MPCAAYSNSTSKYKVISILAHQHCLNSACDKPLDRRQFFSRDSGYNSHSLFCKTAYVTTVSNIVANHNKQAKNNFSHSTEMADHKKGQ